MSSEEYRKLESRSFSRDNMDECLKALAREYRRLNGTKMKAEIILVGGASVVINYGFREMTTDIDAIICASSAMKDAVNHAGDRMGLPNGWFNTDFVRTDSYSDKLIQYSTYYRTYSNVLAIRTIRAEYLIAMKLRSGRQYKRDLSDIVGILAEHSGNGEPISMEQIRTAYTNLYGSWDTVPKHALQYLQMVYSNGNYTALYDVTVGNEKRSRTELIQFQEDYPGVTSSENVNDILASLRTRKTQQDT